MRFIRSIVMAIAIMAIAFVNIDAANATIKSDEGIQPQKYKWEDSWDDNQNNAYIDIVNAIWNMETEVDLSDEYITGTQFMNVWNRVIKEYGQMPFAKFQSISYTDEGYVDNITMSNDLSAKNDNEKWLGEMKELADTVAFANSYVDDTMTDLEKALFLHDFVAQRTMYTFDFKRTSGMGDIHSVLCNHGGICGTIAPAYHSLLEANDIIYADTTGNNHRWTNINIDGKWYVVDSTFDSFTSGSDLKYTVPQHRYFFVGKSEHFEDDIHADYEKYELDMDDIEYDTSAEYWRFEGLASNLAYHVNDNEEHGKIYYLSKASFNDKGKLTTRDSLKSDAEVHIYKDCIYDNIVWVNDRLYGYRGNNIYEIDWNTHEETLVGFVEGNKYYVVKNGANVVAHTFDNDVDAIDGICAENGKLEIRVKFADGKNTELTAMTFDKVEHKVISESQKATISGPTAEPDELLYSLQPGTAMGPYYAEIIGHTDSFKETSGFVIPDNVAGFPVGMIRDKAFQNCGPDVLAGQLTIPETVYGIEYYAFDGCSGLTGDIDLSHITYPIGGAAFRNCSGFDGKLIMNPDYWWGLTRDYIFQNCSSLKSVEGFNPNWNYSNMIFDGCTSLECELDFSGADYIYSNAFADTKISVKPVIGARQLYGSFPNCANISGEISLPNCEELGYDAFAGTNVTRITDTDKIRKLAGRPFTNVNQLTGIMSFPSLATIDGDAFANEGNLTALRFPTKDLKINSLSCFPYSTDVALFVVKGSAVEDTIKEKWTHGVNYWYVDEVIAEGELDNGITWEICGDGVMTVNNSQGADEAGEMPVISVEEGNAPWDNYKRFVEKLEIKGKPVAIASKAFDGFENLEEVNVPAGTTIVDDSFFNCDRLDEDIVLDGKCRHKNIVIDPAVEQTCQEAGLTEGKHCADCGEVIVPQEEVTDDPNVSHTDFGEWMITKEPTCLESGERMRVCAACGREHRVRLQPSHQWASEYLIDVEPTCNSTGMKSIHCINCTATKSETVIPGLEHQWSDEEIIIKEPTCNSAGKKAIACVNCGMPKDDNFVSIPAAGHNWSDGVCTNCGKKDERQEIELDNGETVNADIETETTVEENEVVISESISDEDKSAAEEVATNTTVPESIVDAAVITSGTELIKQLNIEESQDVTINVERQVSMIVKIEEYDADSNAITMDVTPVVTTTVTALNGSDVIDSVSREDTVSELAKDASVNVRVALPDGFGKDGEKVFITLIHNGEPYVFESTVKRDTKGVYTDFDNNVGFSVIKVSKSEPKVEFLWNEDNTCKVTVNGASVADENVDYTQNITKDPTCTEQGEMVITAAVVVNETEMTDSVTVAIPANGHKWNDTYTTDKEPGCAEEGSESIHCVNCDATKDAKPIPVKGHDFGPWTSVESPQCEAEGVEKRTCTLCGYAESRNVEATGHEWNDDYTVDQKPTCQSEGSKSIHCKNCEAVKDSQTIPVTEHNWSEDITPATKEAEGEILQICSSCGEHGGVFTIPMLGTTKLSATSYKYTGGIKLPTVTVTDVNGDVIPSDNYEVVYSNNSAKAIGAYKVDIAFKNYYEGSESLKYTIVPVGTSITKLTKAKKAFTVKWTKKAYTGYQIRYSLKSSMASAKTVNITKPSIYSKKITKLGKKKIYYVQVRTYKTVSGTKYYSAWSTKKSVKTK